MRFYSPRNDLEKMEKSTFLSRIIPGSLIGRIVLLFFFPLFLLLTTVWAALYEPTELSPYLCGMLLFGTTMSLRYRTKGLLIALFSLISIYVFKHEGFQFSEIGLVIASAVDFAIILLVVDEVKASLAGIVEESRSHMNQFLAKNQELVESEESFAKTKQTLEEEIASWKEEAEQRKIDMQLVQQKMQLVQSEIEMLTAQKESILNDSYMVRTEAKEQLAALKEQVAEVERAREEVHRRLEQTQDVAEDQKQRELLQKSLQEAQEKLTQMVERSELEQLQHKLVESEAEAEQLLAQIVELNEQLESSSNSDQVEQLQQKLVESTAEVEQLQAQIVELNEQLENSSGFDQVEQKLVESAAEAEQLRAQIAELKRQLEEASREESLAEVTRVQGLYKQLRSQFEDKTRILDQTRKELFVLQTKWQSQKRSDELELLEGPAEQIQQLERELNVACRECLRLEEEVNSLESLISHILTQ
ncbi:MAG: hypothetical protein SP1CHLAM42_05750 [Chlamydiales bacterium]|nr:hypothetical protein [Chlamydiales bacterium]